MSEVPERARRAFADHDAFDRADDDTFVSTSTPFDGRVTVGESSGRITFDVTVSVPMLDAVVDGEVADVVEEGWYETFALRMEDAGDVTRGDHDLAVDVRCEGDAAVVEASFSDLNERRGVDDAAAIVDYAEGTYVQGVIPGYDYRDPVTSLISRARDAAGGSGGPPL
jgi:hypothetical protein